jgi:superfamily II DNA or RNA helicase
MSYEEFIKRKSAGGDVTGLDGHGTIAGHLFDHQKDIVKWALSRGRAAVFADTGLGKTAIFLEWATHVAVRGRVLILAPLAVAEQIVREGSKFGTACKYLREDDGSTPIVVTNYDMLHAFDPSKFVGVVLDESSILKAYTGKIRTQIIESFAATPYRLACTATPAPNDHTELGNHAEFLGIKSRVEMLAEYFVHDGGETQKWRLKGHAQDVFWEWVSSWACVIRRPSDLGYSDDGFKLPPLRMHEHVIPVDHEDAKQIGMLFAPEARTLSDQRATRRMTMDARVKVAAELAACDDPVLVWCELNDEADAITKSIPDAVQVKGSDSPEDKVDRLLGFAEGRYRVLVTKASIAGFGMNWQHCARMVFAGVSHSYEQTYQAIRRCWRFGQQRPVDVYVIRAETEGAIVANLRRKEADAERMAESMAEQMRGGLTSSGPARREHNQYCPAVTMRVPAWAGEDAA